MAFNEFKLLLHQNEHARLVPRMSKFQCWAHNRERTDNLSVLSSKTETEKELNGNAVAKNR